MTEKETEMRTVQEIVAEMQELELIERAEAARPYGHPDMLAGIHTTRVELRRELSKAKDALRAQLGAVR